MTPIPLSQKEALVRTHESRQKCPKCRNFLWASEMDPKDLGGEWHHPSCPELT